MQPPASNALQSTRELEELRQRVAQLENEAAQRSLKNRELEDWLRLMVDSAPIMMWMSGCDSLCNFFNRRWLEFRGRSMEQEMGNGWTEGVHPEDAQRCLHTYVSCFNLRQEFHMEYRLRRADGAYIWVTDDGMPRYNPGGAFAGYLGCAIPAAGHGLKAVSPRPETPLTKREREVLTLIAEGNSTKEVAATLGISYKTADSHRSKMMDKLKVHETASLVRYAIRMGLVKP